MALQWGGCLTLAVASLVLPSVPTYDPWAWIVFGRELVVPGPGFSTVASTGWKPLAVLFTAPLALLGSAAPSLWLVVVRSAGLVALTLSFRLASRAGGPIAGAIAALALLASSDWLRYLSAGNIEPLVVALMLGAIELHLRGRRQGAFLLGALAGLARPEVWLLVGVYATYVSLSERRWWPLALGVPGMSALWIVPDWLGSGDLLHTFHLARISPEPRSLQGTSDPALELLRGAGAIAPAPVWIGALCGLAFGWRTRDRTVAALALVAAAWALPTVAATALGYPAVARYLVVPVAVCCVLAGIGVVAVVRLASRARARGRAVLAAALVAVSAPFAVSRAVGLAHQSADAKARDQKLSALWRAVDRAQQRAPVARMHPVSSRAAWRTAWPGSSTSASMMSAGGSHRRLASPSSTATPPPSSRDCGAATPPRRDSRPRARGVSFWSGGARAADSMSRSTRAAVSCEQRGDGSSPTKASPSRVVHPASRSAVAPASRRGGWARGGGRCAGTWFGRTGPAHPQRHASIPTLLLFTKPAVGGTPADSRVARFAAQQAIERGL